MFLTGCNGMDDPLDLLPRTLKKFKPSAKRRTIVLLSAMLWSVIGVVIIVRGGCRLGQTGVAFPYILILAPLTGILKSYFILDKSARRSTERILRFEDGRCLGAVYSVRTWCLVLCMMAFGIVLRKSSLPVSVLSFFFIAIGSALVFSSRLAWLEWINYNRRSKYL